MKRFTLVLSGMVLLSLHLTAQVRTMKPEQVQLLFSENKGQWRTNALFRANISNGYLYLKNNSFNFIVYSDSDLSQIHHPMRSTVKITVHGRIFSEVFDGAVAQPALSGANPVSHRENYFLGNKPAYWASGVRLFPEVDYTELYTGINLKVYSRNDGQLEYDFIVKPGADAGRIKVHYDAIESIQIVNNELQVRTGVGVMVEQKPYAYQQIGGAIKEVKCNFVLKGNQFGFEFPEGYDKKYPLVIDPTIVFSTYTGAIADNWGYTATYDEFGNMYLAGLVNAGPDPYNPYDDSLSNYFPTAGAFQTTWGGGNNTDGIAWSCDMGVSKFSPDGSNLIYRTFIGGSNNETPNSLIVDPHNNLIIYGVSYSTNFPVTAGAYDVSYNGLGDIVVVKLDSSGGALLGSTYVGGSNSDGINYDPTEEIAGNLKRNYGDQNRGEVNIDASENIYVASCTMSSDFPVTTGAFQTTSGGGQDGCVFELSSDFSHLIWSSYIGGSSDDACYSLALAGNGDLYVAGGTMSTNFPTVSGSLHTTYLGGNFDGFVSCIKPGGSQLLASSYFGTSGDDQVYCVKLDGNGQVYFVGQTNGAYPVVNAAYSNAGSGQFIGKVTPMLDSVFYSTVFGSGSGAPNISPTAFLVDTCENVYVAGWGTSNSVFTNDFSPIYENYMYNMPLTPDAFKSTTDGTDFYFFVMEKNAASMLFGSYFGGDGYIDHVDGGTSRFDKRGIMYEAICAGCGGNSITPTTPGAWSRTNDSWNCNELGLKIAFNLAGANVTASATPRATGCVPLTVQFNAVINDVQSLEWYFQDGDSSNAQNPVHTFQDTGNYNVMLVGYNPNSCNEYDTAYVDVTVRNDSITADFLPNTVVNCDSNRVTMVTHDFSTSSYFWTLGDGTTATTDSVVHQYSGPGNYTVQLIVTDTTKCNLEDTFSANIFIPPMITAMFTTSGSGGCIPYEVDFTTQSDSNTHYYWDFGDGTTGANSFSVSHTYTAADTFHIVLTVVDSSSCNITDTAFATVITIDSVANADFIFNRTFYYCDSIRAILWSNYQGETSQSWDLGNGTVIDNVDTVSVFYDSAATYTVTHYLYDSNMICKPRDTAQIAFSLKPLNVSIALSDTGGCIPFTVQFTGNSQLLSTNYFWNFDDGDSSHLNPVSHTYYNTGTYRIALYATDTNACVGTDSTFAKITVINDSVHAAFQMNVLSDCDSNLTVSLTNQSTNALQYSWTFGDSTSSNLLNAQHSYYFPGTYTITLVAVDTNRCHPIDSMTEQATLLPNATVNFTDTNVCVSNPIQFINLSNPLAIFIWNFGDNTLSGEYSPLHLYKNPGTYQVQLVIIDSSTCNIIDTVTHPVQLYQQPVAGFLPEGDTVQYQVPVTFTQNSLYYNNLLWNIGNDSSVADENSVEYTFTKLGWTKVCITATDSSCVDTLCRQIFVSFKTLIGVPDAFSPNGDGVNDVLKVEGQGIVQILFRIYNRWGELVFETQNPNEGWDGTYHGVAQPMDVYVYTVEATLLNDQVIPLKGNITLLR